MTLRLPWRVCLRTKIRVFLSVRTAPIVHNGLMNIPVDLGDPGRLFWNRLQASTTSAMSLLINACCSRQPGLWTDSTSWMPLCVGMAPC